MADGPPRRRRARPVADAPIDSLLLRAEDLTKDWLLALLEQAPLDDAPAILAADLARDGPRVCAAVLSALASDADLRRLEPDGALEVLVSEIGSFTGAQDVEAIVRAVDALHTVIWSAVREELVRPDADQVSELAERLARVTELVRGAVLRRAAADMRGPPPPVGAAPVAAAPSSDPLWMGALDDEVTRAERNGTPLSLLLVELEDADRVFAAEDAPRAAATFGQFAQAVRGVARRQDILASDSDARAWVIARDTPRPGARALGERIVSSVREAQPWRGAPLTVSLGLAVFGEDGRDGDALIAAAEQAMFAAAAGGTAIGEGPGALGSRAREPEGQSPSA